MEKTMNEAQLQDLAMRMRELFNEYGIDAEEYQLKVLVSKAYFEAIKGQFSKRHPLDVMVGAGGDDWSIDLIYLASGEVRD